MSIAETHGRELYEALRSRRTVAPLIVRDPALTIDDAYAISLDFLSRRLEDGERVVGKKIGVTSKAVQDMLGVHQPDFGFLLKDSLNGPGVTAADVIAATASIAPCFEIVDSRITDWQIAIVDTVADNASCGVFVLGEQRLNPRALDLPNLHVAVAKNGAPLSEGYGHAVQGDPAQAVAWLANTLGAHGVTLDAGDIILSGSLVPLAPAVKGDCFEMILGDGRRTLGHCVARFV